MIMQSENKLSVLRYATDFAPSHAANNYGMNARIKRLRQQSFEAEPSLSIERALIETRFYQENEGKYPIPVLRALNFLEICKQKTIYIGADELIVGERGPKPKAVPTFPELTCHSVEDLHVLNTRELQRYTISEEDIETYAREVIPYWQGRTQRERIFNHVPQDWKEAYELGEDAGSNIRAFDEYLKETYGTIIYQEQIMRMAVDIAGMTWDEAHNITKMKIGVPKFNYYFENDYPRFEQAFVNGCKKLGVPADTAKDIFKKFYDYSFNKGHSVGYSLISVEQMYYKVYYAEVFWFAKIKYANDDSDFFKYCENAVGDGAVVFLPHVNYSRAKSSLRKIDGEFAIQQGLSSIKGVGEVAANAIVAERKANGIFTSYDNFLDRVQDKKVNKKVLGLLIESGALEFKKSTYISRVKKYNSSLYARADRKRS